MICESWALEQKFLTSDYKNSLHFPAEKAGCFHPSINPASDLFHTLSSMGHQEKLTLYNIHCVHQRNLNINISFCIFASLWSETEKHTNRTKKALQNKILLSSNLIICRTTNCFLHLLRLKTILGLSDIINTQEYWACAIFCNTKMLGEN